MTIIWLAGSNGTSGAAPILTNVFDWQHYVIEFSVGGNIHLMLEDFSGTNPNRPRDAYFDNIVLTAVPIPASLPLLGAALAFMGMLARRRTA